MMKLTDVSKTFKYGKNTLYAVQNVNLTILQGETLGLVGESGCGKSTLGKIVTNLETPSSGTVLFQEKNIHTLSSKQKKALTRHIQVIFQDPYASLNPRMSIEEIIGEGIDIHKIATGRVREQRILELLTQMELDTTILKRYPHTFSGGQRQRIGIARALSVDPTFIVCDEPLSALDACTQQQVIQLLLNLKQQKKLSFLFISHDLHAVRKIADKTAVMYLGTIVEQAPTAQLFNAPAHPYTQALLSTLQPKSTFILKGDPPSPIHLPTGCPFHTRCPKALPICSKVFPSSKQLTKEHSVSCHLFLNN